VGAPRHVVAKGEGSRKSACGVNDMPTTRRRWLAALLSLPLPGLGHLYLGFPYQAMVAFAVPWIAGAVALLVLFWAPRPLNAVAIWLIPLGGIVGVVVHVWRQTRRAANPYVLKWYNRWYVYVPLIAFAMLVLSPAQQRLLRSSLQAFRIPSGSMEPALLVDDFIFVDKRAAARQHLRRGDVITFRSVEEDSLLVIKRIVGLPGDTLQMTAGALFLNGLPAEESYCRCAHGQKQEDPVLRAKMQHWQLVHYVGTSPESYAPDVEEWGPLVVARDSFMVLGDNRDASYDSRYYGFLPSDHIIGQPMMVYWSFDPESYKALPLLSAVRWSRVGLRVEGEE
jgi:signal peptidase I